jgi:hypothetical protein
MHPAVRMVPRTCGVCGTPSTRSSSLPSLFHIYKRCSFFLHPAAERNDRRDEGPSPLQTNSQPRHFCLHHSLIHCRTVLHFSTFFLSFFFNSTAAAFYACTGTAEYCVLMCVESGITKAPDHDGHERIIPSYVE